MSISRRTVLLGIPFILAGCSTRSAYPRRAEAYRPRIDPYYNEIYGPLEDEGFYVRAINLRRIRPQFLRRNVFYETDERPGTIVVDTNRRYLYLVQNGGRAMRYGVGVGREEGFNFKGEAIIARKAKWPRWTPTKNMIAREPERYGPYRDGMAGGLGNPLGPRALYLYRNGKDTYYRLHGTFAPSTIGNMVSSGCVRLLNQDIIDLYDRVPVGTRVVVLPGSSGNV
ncbi:MAG: L,D-transpeptidase [Hyphomicrobiales bacterium]|nr:L,D-transpeptidase [Hyphomicrobiales bacterium]